MLKKKEIKASYINLTIFGQEVYNEIMRITKCDLCKKRIKEKPVIAGIGYFTQAEVCERCGLPIIRFLKQHKFIKEDSLEKSKKR